MPGDSGAAVAVQSPAKGKSLSVLKLDLQTACVVIEEAHATAYAELTVKLSNEDARLADFEGATEDEDLHAAKGSVTDELATWASKSTACVAVLKKKAAAELVAASTETTPELISNITKASRDFVTSKKVKAAFISALLNYSKMIKQLQKASAKNDEATTRAAMTKTKFSHAPAQPMQKLFEDMKAKKRPEGANVDPINVQWSVKRALQEEKPQVAIVAQDIAQDAKNKLLALPYFATQKRWVASVMKQPR